MHKGVKVLMRSRAMRHGILVIAIIAAVGLSGLIPLTAYRRHTPRELVLVVRDMAFYLEGSDVPNPTLRVKPGEDVSVVLRNEEPGVTHDFVVETLQAAIEPVRGSATGRISFRVPAEPGRHEYRCTPHARMMNGVFLVE